MDTIALVRHIDTSLITLQRRFQSSEHPICSKAHVYLGVYGGRVKTVDREAQGILTYDLDQLSEEMHEYPGLFTDDLRVLLKQYYQDIVSFRSLISSKAA